MFLFKCDIKKSMKNKNKKKRSFFGLTSLSYRGAVLFAVGGALRRGRRLLGAGHARLRQRLPRQRAREPPGSSRAPPSAFLRVP